MVQNVSMLTRSLFEVKTSGGPDSWDYRYDDAFYDFVEIPKGSIKKLIGKELSWNDEAVKLG